jgi:hypothetical protein
MTRASNTAARPLPSSRSDAENPSFLQRAQDREPSHRHDVMGFVDDQDLNAGQSIEPIDERLHHADQHRGVEIFRISRCDHAVIETLGD